MKSKKSTQLIRSLALILLGSCNLAPLFQNGVAAQSKTNTLQNEIIDQSTGFFCDEVADSSTLIARSDLGNIPIIIFERNVGEWTTLKRCQEVANRFMKFHQEQRLTSLTWAREPSGGRVINISKHEGDLYKSAEFVELLFTLKQDDKPHEILAALRGILSSYGNDFPIRN